MDSLALRVFDDLDEESEGIVGSRFGVNKEYSRAAGTFARSFIDDLESARFHRIEGLLGAFHPERDMSQTAPAAIPFDQFLHRRIRT